MNDWLNEIVKCPKCHQDVREGDRIWLDGECLCPDCYMSKRRTYDNLIKQGYDKAKREQ